MRIDFQIALILAIAALPAGVAVSEAIEYFPYLKAHPGLSFWASTLVTLALFASACALAVRGERDAEREGAKRRIIPLIVVTVFALGFLGSSTWYFWPQSTSQSASPLSALPSSNKSDESRKPLSMRQLFDSEFDGLAKISMQSEVKDQNDSYALLIINI
jgi:hypothetical protein